MMAMIKFVIKMSILRKFSVNCMKGIYSLRKNKKKAFTANRVNTFLHHIIA
jgi:hypothetical protein